jgi:hypothetical protein
MASIRQYLALFRVPTVSSLPTPVAGALVILASDNKLYVSDGTGWSISF